MLPDSMQIDSLPSDTLGSDKQAFIVISPDSLDAKVEYGSLDSNYLDNKTRKVHLYGNAYVRYKDLALTADYIVVDLDSSIAVAVGLPDSSGVLAGNPEFKMGEESFVAKRIRYNFRTRKGFIYNVVTEESDLIIHGSKTKFVAGSGETDDILYNQGALITSCDHPEPHYGVWSKKVKTIPDKLAVVGPSNLQIFGVPTPIWLPFGFYPVPESRQAGLIIPRDYEQSRDYGFGIKEFGYYFPHRDWADVRITGDIYFNGSWALGANTNYVKKYKFRGNLDLRYSNLQAEADDSYIKLSRKSFLFRLNHNQDPKAHPYQTLQGSINIQSNDFESLNYNDAQSALTNTYSSNFSYNRIFPGKPYTFAASFNHSQNTNTHIVTINAPTLDFRLNRIYPFKSATRPGPDRWYEKIAFQYSANAKSQIVSTDTTLFDPVTWQNAQAGAQHKASANVNFNVLKYFNFTPSVNYEETWFLKTREHKFRFDPSDPQFVKPDTIYYPDSTGFIVVPDTVSFGVVDDTIFSNKLRAFRSMSASVTMNTQIFGTMQFGKGWLRGLRHVMKPAIGFSYSPRSSDSSFQYSRFNILDDSLARFSRFENLLYGVRPVLEEQANLNYSFNNIFEGKYFSKRDSTEKKFKLFDNIVVSGSYNMAADYFKFSPVNINGNTRFFRGITTLSVGASYSFYGLRDDFRLDTSLYINTHNKLLRFDNMRIRLSSRITLADIIGLFSGQKADDAPQPIRQSGPSDRPPVTEDKFFDLFSRFSINHEFGLSRMDMVNRRDTTIITTHTVNMVGSIQLTPNWSINIGNVGYDFQSDRITYPDIGIARDLHCWQIGFNFQPERETFSFHIGVKPGSFDFLKLPYRRGRNDAFGF